MNLCYALWFFLLFFTTTIDASTEQNRAVSQATQIINTTISYNQQISSSSLNSSTSAATKGGQFVITQPGRYFLSTNILAAPSASRTPCIYINASDVILDLGGRALTLSTTTNQKNSAAIEIAENKSGITIKNGTLNGRAGTSSVYTTTGIKVNTGANNILIENVQIINFAERGLIFDTGGSNIILNNVHAYNNGIAAAFTARCMSLDSCNDVTIIDSSFNKTNSTCPNSTYGIFASSCNNIQLFNVQIFNTTATDGYIRALWLYDCTGVTCNNVHVSSCSSGNNPAYEVVGIDLLGSTDCSFLNCCANNGLSSHYTTSTYGFKLSNGSNNNTFINCEAKNNQGGGTSAAFRISASHNNQFQNCSAIGNGGYSHLTYGFQTGLNTRSGIASDLTLSCSSNSFKECKANCNTATAGDTFGFDLSGDTGSVIQSCEIKTNIASGACYGIALHHSCIKTAVAYNTIYANIGTTGQYGFKDFASNSTTFLHGNVSFGHGPTFFSGNAVLVDAGFMNYMLSYSAPADIMNAQFLIKEGNITSMNAFVLGSPTWLNYSVLHNSIAG